MATKSPPTRTEIQLSREVCQESLYDYVVESWPTLEPSHDFIPGMGDSGGHIRLICDILTLIFQRKMKRVILNIPPRYMKSLLVSAMFPTWVWATDPGHRFIAASYSASLAKKFSLKREFLVQSAWYQQRWGHMYHLIKATETEMINNHQGHMLSFGLEGAITGEGGDTILIDDPMNPKESWSEAMRTNANRIYDQTIPSRLDDKINGSIVIIMQRLHQEDTAGHVTGIEPDELTGWHIEKKGWNVYRLSGLAETYEEVTSPLTGELLFTRDEGDPLWPEREPLELVQAQMIDLGEFGFAGQYQQRPVAKGGAVIKKEWLKFYDKAPTRFDFLCQSWDLTFKGTTKSDWVIGQSWGKLGVDYYLLNQVRGKWGFNDQIKHVVAEAETPYGKRGPKLVEDAANGAALVETLKEYVDGIMLWPVYDSKVNRMEAQSDLFESGHVWIPDPEKVGWVKDYISELTIFPNGANDDMCDATSQALQFLREKGGKPLATADRLLRRNIFVQGV